MKNSDLLRFVEGYVASNRDKVSLMNFTLGIHRLLRTIYRVLKPHGEAVIVMGDFRIGGVYVDSNLLIKEIAEESSLKYTNNYQRLIPSNRRYLPPPEISKSALGKRLRFETVTNLIKSPNRF